MTTVYVVTSVYTYFGDDEPAFWTSIAANKTAALSEMEAIVTEKVKQGYVLESNEDDYVQLKREAVPYCIDRTMVRIDEQNIS